MEAQNLDAGDVLDHRPHDWARRFDQLRPDLLEQIPSSLWRERLGQLLFGRGEHTLEADDEEIADQMGVNVFWTSTHVFLLEVTHPFTDSAFDFTLRFHSALACVSSTLDPRASNPAAAIRWRYPAVFYQVRKNNPLTFRLGPVD